VTLSALALCLWWLCYDFDSGPFTKVACFDPVKGGGEWYGRALPVPLVDVWLQGPFDLEILATRNSLLISLNLAQKVSKSAKEK
jgi:hypothetical protein